MTELTLIHAIETARSLHDPAPESQAEYPDYSRGQADLIGDLFGFTSEDKEDIIAVIRQQVSLGSFAVTMLQRGWDRDPSERQRQTTTELASWLAGHIRED